MALQNAFANLALDSSSQQILTELQKKTNQNQVQTIADSTDTEYIVVNQLVTTIGNTTLRTPATGKRIRLHWVYALNDPFATNSTVITISLGNATKYLVYGVSKRQVLTGHIDGALVINLSQSASVACTFFLEEI